MTIEIDYCSRCGHLHPRDELLTMGEWLICDDCYEDL
jgi:hypothetical protein